MTSEARRMAVELFERWNGGERDFDPSLFAESVAVHSAMTKDTYTGVDGLRKWVSEIDEQFSAWTLELDAFDEPEAGTVVATGRITGEGRASGAPFQQPASWIVEVEEGRVRVLRTFLGADAARDFLRAAGTLE